MVQCGYSRLADRIIDRSGLRDTVDRFIDFPLLSGSGARSSGAPSDDADAVGRHAPRAPPAGEYGRGTVGVR